MRYLCICLLLFSLVVSCKEEAPKPRPIAQTTDFDILREKIKNNPRDVDSLYSLANLYDRAGMYKEETELLQKVVAIKPELGKGYAYLLLGNAYNRLNQYQNAIKSFLKAEKYNPRNAVLYNNLAYSYGRLGKTDQEIASLKKAIEIRPKYATARFNLGVTYLKKGDRNGALIQYQKLKEFDEGAAGSLKAEIDKKEK